MSDAKPLTDRATLHRVALKVRPLPGHPQYWRCQFGILNVWLYADSVEGAGAAAETIVAALPYELAGGKLAVYKSESEKPVQFAIREQLAAESGLSLLLMGMEVGADETVWETIHL
jgi:hypothetical protein